MVIVTVQISAKANLTLKARAEVLSTQFSEKQPQYQQQKPESSAVSIKLGPKKLAKCDRNC